MRRRMKPPVFVLGCPRSGTTLLYHMLLSSGGFAVYRTESHVFDMILPKFGNLRSLKSRERLMEQWLHSHYWRLSGLDAEAIKAKVLSECKEGEQFLSIVMDSIAENQNVDRWAEATPAHLLYINQIKKALPEALVVHIIRDGRDCALSIDKQGWITPFPWDKKYRLHVAGLYWEWMVRRGREYGRMIAPDYMEVRFEDLIGNPREVLNRIGSFIHHDLDYDRIREVGIGSVSQPNSSFWEESSQNGFTPIGRWKKKFTAEDLAVFEALVGSCLEELGYPLAASNQPLPARLRAKSMRAFYPLYFDLKQWIKTYTPLSRLMIDTSLMRYGTEYARR